MASENPRLVIVAALRAPAGVDDFLGEAESSSEAWTSVTTVLALAGVVIAAGLVAFTLLVVRRQVPRALGSVTALVALAGAVGAALEARRVADRLGIDWWDALTAADAAAALLRLVAATAMAVGAIQWLADDRREPGSPGVAATTLLVAGALAGCFSFGFDGHTLSRGPELAHRVVSVVHAGAGAIWAGGVVGLAMVAVTDAGHRRRIVVTLVRFSSVATVALVAAGVAGAVMSFWIVDGVGDYVSTTWGRVLLAKLAAVAIAAGFGARHHWQLVPAIESAPDDPELHARARRSFVAEAGVLGVVVVLTGVLVGASTV